jgi:hypothetical protein
MHLVVFGGKINKYWLNDNNCHLVKALNKSEIKPINYAEA